MGNIYLCYEKKWEESIHSSYLNVKFLNCTTHIVAPADLNLKQKLRKKWRTILNTYELSDRQFESCWGCFES
jgi:hypothetical protein